MTKSTGDYGFPSCSHTSTRIHRTNPSVLSICSEKHDGKPLAERLQPIFGGKKLDMFQMTNAVNRHLK
ncbi:MAG: hypothetical protein DMG79_04985 [Acidobacteria bacterium]|nr:MAG: hypothetical protein DMG79_04985 [Acidobacteriota bacterium]